MKSIKTLFAVVLVFTTYSLSSFAGNGIQTLKGRIIDADNRESVPGATIKNELSGETFYTDLDGYFEIPVKQGQKPAFTIQSLSYQDQSLQLENVPFSEIKLELHSK